MASSSFLKPNREKKKEIQYVQIEDTSSLKRDKFLGEYSTEEEKAIIRHNLNVPSADVVLSKKDIESKIKDAISKAVKEHLSLEDPHSFNDVVNKAVLGSIKNNGSTPFIVPLSGKDPTKAEHLATKRYIDDIIKKSVDDIITKFKKEIKDSELAILKKFSNYSTTKDIEKRNKDTIQNLYSKSEINKLIESLNKKIRGCVDDKYVKRELEQTTRDYATKKDMLSLSTRLMSMLNSSDKQQDEEDTVSDELLLQSLIEQESTKEDIWITDGPTLFDVGMLKKGTVLPKLLTLQHLCDAIFYGRCITLSVPESCPIDETTKISIRLTGDTTNLEFVLVLLNGEDIAIINKGYFSEEEVVLDTEPISEDTTIIVRAFYSNDIILSDEQEIKCAFPVFVGLMQDWFPIENIVSEHLLNSNSTNNKVLNLASDVLNIPFKYDFKDNGLIYRIMLAVPNSFPSLKCLKSGTTRLYKKYFSIHLLPFTVNGKSVLYKIYLLEQPLSNLNKNVVFIFNKQKK